MKIKVFVIGVLILSYFSAAALKSASEFSGVPARGVVVHRKEDAAFIQEEKRLAKEEGILQAAIEAARRGIQIGLGDEIIAKASNTESTGFASR